MTLEQIWSAGGILIILSMIIQIAPIKLNPWTKILRGLGKLLNSEVVYLINEREANSCRYRILRFDDEIRHKQKHTKEHFDQMLEDIDGYEKFCKDHPEYPNSKAVEAINNIRTTYRQCIDQSSFL